jgi:Fe2+ transport system protein FeoA
LRERLERLGIYQGCGLHLEDEEVQFSPVRVRGPKGKATLAAGMASKVIVHHDDDHKTPVIEMLPGEEGHIEGLTSGTGLEQALATLGLREHDRIRFLRRIPPMRYRARLGEHARLALTEGVAAKLWGELDGREIQFSNARRGHPFKLLSVLGGDASQQQVAAIGIGPGDVLTLEAVCPDDALGQQAGAEAGRQRFVVTSEDGLRLYLEPQQAASVIVDVET